MILFRRVVVGIVGVGLCLVNTAVGRDKDPLNDLIEKEKSAVQEWSEESSGDEALPDLLLPAAGTEAVLYADRLFEQTSLRLCEPMRLDELAELTRGNSADERTVLNFQLPRVREFIGQRCLVRINDPLIAVGPGSNSLVFIQEMAVEKVPSVCSSDSEFEFRARLTPRPEQRPLFYSTDVDIGEGENQFRPLKEEEANPPDPVLQAALKEKIEFLDEYAVFVWKIDSAADQLVLLKRIKVSLDDIGLPARIGLIFREGALEELMVERVHKDAPATSIRPSAVLDYNRDGYLDVVFKGYDAHCSYFYIFKGGADGFQAVPFPNPDCPC